MESKRLESGPLRRLSRQFTERTRQFRADDHGDPPDEAKATKKDERNLEKKFGKSIHIGTPSAPMISFTTSLAS